VARKIGVFLLSAVFIFAFAAGAEAVRQRFGNIAADVPAGWTIEGSENRVTFVAPDESAMVSIMVNVAEGFTLQEIAETVAQEYGGSALQEVGGAYVFGFQNEYEVDYSVIISGDEETGFYMVWVIAGEHPQLGALIESIEWVE